MTKVRLEWPKATSEPLARASYAENTPRNSVWSLIRPVVRKDSTKVNQAASHRQEYS